MKFNKFIFFKNKIKKYFTKIKLRKTIYHINKNDILSNFFHVITNLDIEI